MRTASASMRSSERAVAGGTSSGERRTSSAYPRMEASGVRSSWDTSAAHRRPGVGPRLGPGARVRPTVSRRRGDDERDPLVAVDLGHPHEQRLAAAVERRGAGRGVRSGLWLFCADLRSGARRLARRLIARRLFLAGLLLSHKHI